MKKRSYNLIDSDFKATVIAAELVEDGAVSDDQIVILPIGSHRRAYSKDVGDVSTYISAFHNLKMTNIQINREGLYDMLPEGLFHAPPITNVLATEETMIKGIKKRREEEKEARQFFAPLEAELYQMRMRIELYESHLDKKNKYDSLILIFLKEWTEFTCFDKEQMVVFLQVLPIIHEHRNDLNFISSILAMLFKVSVNLNYVDGEMNVPEAVLEAIDTKLGAADLGVNFIAGRIKEKEEKLKIEIGPLSANKMLEFLPGNKTSEALNVFLSYFIPFSTEIIFKYDIDIDSQKFVMGNESVNCCMGYTTFLN
ncbi:type VI secretion system protein ImpH [Pedobacter sp. UYP30]|uniref:type VI secretion system baseplate subunit TssG n=1 Tax=Pedobacter sp. UYP30 TaxID=1756400 RepID=UPI0033989BA1